MLFVLKRRDAGRTEKVSSAERKKLEGKWTVVRAAGKNVKDDLIESFSKNGRITVTGSVLTIHISSEKPSEAVYMLDPSKTPKQIDLFDRGDGRPMRGIYKFENGRLTICLNPKEQQQVRPDRFDTHQEGPDQLMLLVLERQQPQADTTSDETNRPGI